MKKLGFGFMRLPLTDANDQTSINLDELKEMVDLFMQAGFTYFDTAWMYHNHVSEKVLKTVLVDRYPRDRYSVATKLPIMMLESAEQQGQVFAEQQKKCGLDFFDYYMVHGLNADYYEKAKEFESFDFIRQKKAAGAVGQIGFSFHDDAQLLDRILSEQPDMDFVQLQINYLDWDNDGIQSRQCYEVARKHGKPVIVMEPVKGGTLAAVPKEVEAVFKARRPELSVTSWAIRFAAGLEGVMVVLSGMSNLAQLTDNVSYMRDFEPLSQEEQESLLRAKEAINATIAIPCTSCRYCVDDCPQNIPIPNYFSLYNAHLMDVNKLWAVQGAYYENFTKKYGKSSDCIACRRCEAHCPQHLEIVEGLKKVAAAFEKA